MSDLKLLEMKRFRLLIVGLLAISFMATVWSTLLMLRSTEANRRETASLLPLLEHAEQFERSTLNARIYFIYHVTINKPGALSHGWVFYSDAQTELIRLQALARDHSRFALLEPQLDSLAREWQAYRVRLDSTLALVGGGTRSGSVYDQTITEWASQGNKLVNSAHDLVRTTVSLSRGQNDQTGDMLRLSTWIIVINGSLSLLLTGGLIVMIDRRSQNRTRKLLSRNQRLAQGLRLTGSCLTRGYEMLTGIKTSNAMLAGLAGMVLLIVVVLSTGFAALRGIASLSRAQQAALHAQQSLVVIENLRSLTLSAESENRAYLVAAQPLQLAAQQSQMALAWQQFYLLRQKVGSDPSHRARLNKIQSALTMRFANLRTISQARGQYGPAAAAAAVQQMTPLHLKEELQNAIDGFESFEYQGVVDGTLRAERAAASSKTLIVFAALPAAITLVMLSVVMTHLLSRSKQLQEQLTRQASHDILTGLPNRLVLSDRLNDLIDRARNEQTHCAVLGIDLDHFKAINDRYGHHEGDVFLRAVASRLSSAIRAGDTLIRIGGDEFLCLVGGIRTTEDAELVARKLLASLADPILLATASVKASASIGLAVFPEHGDNPEILTKHADDALYQAKEAGRNQYHCFKENEAKIRLRLLEECLETALEQNLFHLVYQPQYTAAGTLRGFEALLRLTHPILGPISPLEFIPLVERNCLIVPIGAWVLQEACSTFVGWLAAGMEPGLLSLNVSATQFAGSNLHQTVAATLRACGLAPSRLELELTESTVMEDVAEATRQMNALAGEGIRLAIDDFGTGYSSLEQLNRLPLSTLKIDRSFVRQLGEDNSTRPIIEAVVALGKALSLEIVVEGVETEAQRKTLASIGCDHFQGFLFARPLVEAAAAALVQSAPFFAPAARYTLLPNTPAFLV